MSPLAQQNNNLNNNGDYWIYHERQDALLCGQHALNNLVQAPAFSADSLAEVAHQLDELELSYLAENTEGGKNSKEYQDRLKEESHNVDASGNFSIQVLRAALQHQYGIELNVSNTNNNQQQEQQTTTNDEDIIMEGYLCHKSDHWFAIRKIRDRYWDLNSTLDKPVCMSEFGWSSYCHALKADYVMFGIPRLPPASDVPLGGSGRWWKEEELLLNNEPKKENNDDDPWKNVGAGMRLDGKTNDNEDNTAFMTGKNDNDDDAIMDMQLSEEEMLLQVAMAQSLSHQQAKDQVLDEPPADAGGIVRLQFRMPNGTRVTRRFWSGETVDTLYAFCRHRTSSVDCELKCGFPPQDMNSMRKQTLEEAKVDGASIVCRIIHT